ncbi:hypothetical protein FRC17_005797, partial [Serendipita sp. 399]
MLTTGEHQSTSTCTHPASFITNTNERTTISTAAEPPQYGISCDGAIIGTAIDDLPYLPLVGLRQDNNNEEDDNG